MYLILWQLPTNPLRRSVTKKEMIIHTLSAFQMILINSTPAIPKGILKGSKTLQDMLDIIIPNQWTEFSDGICSNRFQINKIFTKTRIFILSKRVVPSTCPPPSFINSI